MSRRGGSGAQRSEESAFGCGQGPRCKTRIVPIPTLNQSQLSTLLLALPHLRPTTYLLSFQQHSRYERLKSLVFIDIPGLPWAVESQPFVFIDIPA